MRSPVARLRSATVFSGDGDAYATVNPATGEQIRVFPEIGDAELLDALNTADTCYRNDWSLRSAKKRADVVAGAQPT